MIKAVFKFAIYFSSIILFSQTDQYASINAAFHQKKYEDVITIYNKINKPVKKVENQLKINLMAAEAACKTERWDSGKKMYKYIIENYEDHLPSNYVNSLWKLADKCHDEVDENIKLNLSTNEMVYLSFLATDNVRKSSAGGSISPAGYEARKEAREKELEMKEKELEKNKKLKARFLKIKEKSIPVPPNIEDH